MADLTKGGSNGQEKKPVGDDHGGGARPRHKRRGRPRLPEKSVQVCFAVKEGVHGEIKHRARVACQSLGAWLRDLVTIGLTQEKKSQPEASLEGREASASRPSPEIVPPLPPTVPGIPSLADLIEGKY